MNVVSSRRVIYLGLALVGGVAASARAEKLLFDFGDNSSYRGISVNPNPDANGNTWNEIHTGAYFQNLLDTTGATTTVAMGFSTPVGTDSYNGPAGATDNFGGPGNDLNSFTLDPALGDLDNNAAAIDYVNSAGGPCQFVLNGLNSAETYTLVLYGSQQYSTDQNTVYSVFSDAGYANELGSATLQVGNGGNSPNLSQVATISGLTPNAGSLFVQFIGQQGDTGYLNSMELIGNTATPTSTWAINASGDWNTAANWGGTIPNGIDATANLLGAITTNQVVNTDIPITVGTMVFNNSAASYSITGAVGASLTLQVSTGSALVDVQAGTHEINLPLILASNTTFQTDAATASLIIGDPITINSGITLTAAGTGTVTYQSDITLQSNATMNIANSTYAHALSIASGATVNLTSTTGPRTLLELSSLSNSGTLNTNNNDMIIHGGTSLATVTSQIASGYNGGTWTGIGITSASAAGDSSHLHALGVAPVTTAGTFDGAAVAAGDVEVKYTYYGDANLDGSVNAADYLQIDNGFNSQGGGSPLGGWYNGDFNYDGKINGDDYTLIDNAYNSQGSVSNTSVPASNLEMVATDTAQIASVSTSAVPEPTTLGIVVLQVVGVVGTRRRRK